MPWVLFPFFTPIVFPQSEFVYCLYQVCFDWPDRSALCHCGNNGILFLEHSGGDFTCNKKQWVSNIVVYFLDYVSRCPICSVDLVDMAMFVRIYRGNVDQMGHPSQSQALLLSGPCLVRPRLFKFGIFDGSSVSYFFAEYHILAVSVKRSQVNEVSPPHCANRRFHSPGKKSSIHA